MKIKEYILIGITILIILLINNLPLLVGYYSGKKELVFLGRRVVNSQDVYTYLAFIEQAKQGKNLFANLYTTEKQVERLFRPSYLLIGKTAKLLGLSSIAAYHFFRIILNLIFFYVLYKFLANFFAEKWKKLFAFIIVLSSSGLGYLLGKWAVNSVDLWVPEAITFMSLAEAPHFILSQILMILFFFNFLKKRYFLSGIFIFLLSFEHPYNLVPMLFTIVTFLLWKRGFSLSTLWIFIFSGLGLGYQLLELITNPVLKTWSAQNILLSPDPVNYFVGFGLLIFLALIGGENYLQDDKEEKSLIIVWFAASLILPFFPVNFQRRFIEGAHIPLAILASEGLFFLVNKQAKTSRLIFIGITIFILALSSISLVIRDIKDISKESTAGYYYFILKEEKTALSWLKENSKIDDGIMANWFYGNIIPGLTGRRVYLGHKIQTPDFDKKVEQINLFLLNKDDDSAYKFLKENNLKYIFLGKNDSMIIYGFKPEEKPYLTKAYDKEDIKIYKVK